MAMTCCELLVVARQNVKTVHTSSQLGIQIEGRILVRMNWEGSCPITYPVVHATSIRFSWFESI